MDRERRHCCGNCNKILLPNVNWNAVKLDQLTLHLYTERERGGVNKERGRRRGKKMHVGKRVRVRERQKEREREGKSKSFNQVIQMSS